MSKVIDNNKRIAKNTMLLYVRMFVLMAVNLFTSRVILQCLGVEDFGLYGIVGSVVTLFTFLNSALSTCTSRFLSFYIGKNEDENVNKVFSASINLYLLMLAIIVFFAETVGLYVVNYILNIPQDRMLAANIVYQFSILTFCATLMRIPYNACIVSYEKMNFYAYLSIADVVVKLGGVYILYLFSTHRLELYSVIIFVITLIITFAYFMYCRLNIQTSQYNGKNIEKSLYKQLFGFSGWSLFSGISNMGANTGVNMLLNVFWGVAVNAAVGIANQVSNAMFMFVSNFQTAFTPQITKLYASKNYEQCYRLVFHSSKFSFFLFGILITPIMFAIYPLLHLWLGAVPGYACEFSLLILGYLLIDALFAPLWLFVDATGKIRTHQIVTGLFTIATFPVAYLLLKAGYSPNSVWWGRIFINLGANIFRILYVGKVFDFPSLKYCFQVLVPVILISLIIYILNLCIYDYCKTSLLLVFIYIVMSYFLSLLVVYILGLTKNEKDFLKNIVVGKFKRCR